MELVYPRKRWVNKNGGGEEGILEIVLAGRRENDAPCDKKGLPGGSGEGENHKD